MTRFVYIVLVIGVVLMPNAESNDTCTICNCIECLLDPDDCKEIMDAVVDITDKEKKAKHIQTLYSVYVQSNDRYRAAAKALQKEPMEECPELEELD